MTLTRMLALALAVPLVAQASQRHLWASVRAISVGSRVSVQTLDKSWVPQREELVKGTLESVSEDSLVLRAGVSQLRSIPRSSILKVKVFQGSGKRNVVALATSGLTAILMFGVIPNKLYDIPKSIMLAIAAGVTAPVTYFVFRGTRTKTVYRADVP